MSPPAAAVISVRSTLALLDGQFTTFAEGVSDGKYAFWLGSGISLGRVPGLRGVVEKVIEFVRARINPIDANCKFRKVMQEILDLAIASPSERAEIDFSQDAATWPPLSAIVDRLVANYAKLLGIPVDDEEFDYLVWEAVDVRGTYGSPQLEPDVEHICIAALSLEGVVSEIASANWDVLIEKAVHQLTDGNPALSMSVVVRPPDLQQGRNVTRLIKFHGCAEKAAADPGTYRPWLVASTDQVTGWCGNPRNSALMTALVGILNSKPTLMLGLSAQDANIQHIFNSAAAGLSWQLGNPPPSYVFSEDALGIDQKALLRNVYREQISPANIADVLDRSRVQAYAKPLLTALYIDVLCRKLQALISLAPSSLSQAERQPLKDGIRELRDNLAGSATPDLGFVNSLLVRVGRARKLLRTGHIENPKLKYQAVSMQSVPALQANPDLQASGLEEAAVALGLLGYGVHRGDWTVSGEGMDVDSGVLSITGTTPGATRTKLFFAGNSESATRLRINSHVVEEQAPVVAQSKSLAPAMQRSPRGPTGRTLTPEVTEICVSDLLTEATTFTTLYNRFRSEIGI